MATNNGASAWAAERGEKWSAQLAGIEAMLKPVNQPLIAALRVDAPVRIADVGCGGGATAFELLRRAPAGSVVHGFDISPVLIELARRRILPGEGAIDFRVADLATVTPEQTYDRLVSRFGVMFFDEPRAAFANLARWLAPNGRFAFAVWGPVAENPWLTTVRDVVAEIVDLPRPEPDAPGPFRYAEVGGLVALLEQAGLGELDVHEWRGALPIGGAMPTEEATQFAIAAFSSFGDLLAQKGADAVAEARRSLRARYAWYEGRGEVRMDGCVRIVTGARVA
jgi:SAM-dependent methyltransferase